MATAEGSPRSGTAPLAPPPQRTRLSQPTTPRILLTSTLAFASGAALGLSQGGKTAALVFRAENAHRLPRSQTGWYLYHKTKNYHVMFGAVREAAAMGGRVGAWAAGFFVVEEAVDRLRGAVDAGGSTVAGLSVAGAFSWWNRLPLIAAAKTTKLGLMLGLGYGLAQDALALLKGQRLGYVDAVRRLFGRQPLLVSGESTND